MLAAVLVWLSSSAFAAPFYVEGPPSVDKAAATEQARAAKSAGYDARVVRRYEKGMGWRYVVVVEGIPDQAGANEAAGKLDDVLGSVAVYELDDGAARPVEIAATVEAPAAPVSDADALALLTRAIEAHGGPDGGRAVLAGAAAVKFEFRRTLPDGLVARHVYARRGADVYAEVRIEEGKGVSSRAGIAGGQAWLAPDGQAAAAQDRERTAEQIGLFAPEQVLAFALGFGPAATERRELRAMTRAGAEDVGGDTCQVLRFAGDGDVAALGLWIEKGKGWVRRVEFASPDGDLVVEYSDWRVIADGLVVPGRMVTERGGVRVDDVEIIGLSVNPRLPDDWFRAAQASGGASPS